MENEHKIESAAVETLIIMAVEEELSHAKKVYGDVYNTHHEAFAVLKEEVEEVLHEAEKFETCMNELWGMVKRDADPELQLFRMRRIIQNMICESLQVAAVIDKYRETNERFTTEVMVNE